MVRFVSFETCHQRKRVGKERSSHLSGQQINTSVARRIRGQQQDVVHCLRVARGQQFRRRYVVYVAVSRMINWWWCCSGGVVVVVFADCLTVQLLVYLNFCLLPCFVLCVVCLFCSVCFVTGTLTRLKTFKTPPL